MFTRRLRQRSGSRDGIETAAPKRLTAEKPPEREPTPAERAVPDPALDWLRRARKRVMLRQAVTR